MASITQISVISDIAAGVGADVLTAVLKSVAGRGIAFIGEKIDRSVIEKEFEKRLIALPIGQGALFGFTRFRAPDGRTLEHGPIPLGEGTRPAAPLVSLGFSNKAARQMGADVVEALKPPAGTQWRGMTFYWAVRTADRVEIFHVDDPAALQAEAIGSIYRQQALTILASQGDTLSKLTRQAELFDELETQMREEIRKAGIEAELAGIRQQMRQADALFRRAQADRDAAIARAEKARGLQEVTRLLGLAASFTNMVDVAMARADYATSEQKSATEIYNINVNKYILFFRENKNISSDALPEEPLLPPVEPLP
ncbi:MAG: hypothetical protein GDA39_07350 [Hyphomonadaceae bacterium]|nr:hypothetical protein [Hyphomonadaceae bacterium]MBC6412692.1 hypothetical protein [Hyphomonadaceae bacterium]